MNKLHEISLIGEIFDIKRQLMEAREKRDYRPVIVAVIETPENEILLVRSVKSVNGWNYPQGGIDDEEDIIEALFREIQEETGITSDLLELIQHLGVQDLDIPHTSDRDHREYSRGKRYFSFLLKYSGFKEIQLCSEELDQFKWCSRDALLETVACVREEKRRFILDILEMATKSK